MVNSESQTKEQEQAVKQRNESSDSESSSRVTDDRPDSLQSEVSHTESLDGTGAPSVAAEPPDHTAGAQRDQAAAASEEPSGRPVDAGSDDPNSSGDKKVVKTAPGGIVTHRPLEESKNVISPSGTGKKTNAANQKTAETRDSVLDHSANLEQKGQTNQKGKNKSKKETAEPKVASGSETASQVTLNNVHKAPRCTQV